MAMIALTLPRGRLPMRQAALHGGGRVGLHRHLPLPQLPERHRRRLLRRSRHPPEAALTITGKPKTFRDAGDSGKAMFRRFCSDCGSTLFDTAEAIPGAVMVMIGTLDDPSWAKPAMEISRHGDFLRQCPALGFARRRYAAVPADDWLNAVATVPTSVTARNDRTPARHWSAGVPRCTRGKSGPP